MFFKLILFLSAVIVSFSFGVSVGHYKHFPYDLIKFAKAELYQPQFSETRQYLGHVALFGGIERKYDLVFLGDSITASGLWSELFPSKRVANRGIGGDTSEGVLKRVEQVINLNPSRVYLMFGVNDIMRGEDIEDVFCNYTKVIHRLRESDIEVVVQSTLFTSSMDWNNRITVLNSMLEEYSSSEGVLFVDLNAVLAPEGILNNSLDGVHLAADSYLYWRDVLIGK